MSRTGQSSSLTDDTLTTVSRDTLRHKDNERRLLAEIELRAGAVRGSKSDVA